MLIMLKWNNSNASIFIWPTDLGEEGESLDETVVDTVEVMSLLHLLYCTVMQNLWHKEGNVVFIVYWIFGVICF